MHWRCRHCPSLCNHITLLNSCITQRMHIAKHEVHTVHVLHNHRSQHCSYKRKPQVCTGRLYRSKYYIVQTMNNSSADKSDSSKEFFARWYSTHKSAHILILFQKQFFQYYYSLDYHKQILDFHCRVCGGKLKKQYNKYLCSEHEDDLKSAFGVAFRQSPNERVPPYFCKLCFVVMHNIVEARRKNHTYHHSVAIWTWEEHKDVGCKGKMSKIITFNYSI